MSEKCPVCEHPVGDGAIKCGRCGFEDELGINRVWLNVEDANRWMEAVVKPYRVGWGAKKQSRPRRQRAPAIFWWIIAAVMVVYLGWIVYSDYEAPKEKNYIEPIVATEVVASSFTDSRNGQTYRTIKIGNQTWMAENLNYKTGTSWCYGGDASNCKKYGRLYDWKTAKSACPKGWHLSSRDEWDKLTEGAGGWEIAGNRLKSETGWGGSDNGNGTDEYGFTALPGGQRYYGKDGVSFSGVDDNGYWWITHEIRDWAYYLTISSYGGHVIDYGDRNKNTGCSVRCVAKVRGQAQGTPLP